MAAVTTAELKRLDKESLAMIAQKVAARARKYREQAKVAGEQMMEMTVAIGSAGAVGYYIGMRERDNPGDPDATKIAGVDIDLLTGVALAGIGMTNLAGKKFSPTARAAGQGCLALWLGNFMREKAKTSEA